MLECGANLNLNTFCTMKPTGRCVSSVQPYCQVVRVYRNLVINIFPSLEMLHDFTRSRYVTM